MVVTNALAYFRQPVTNVYKLGQAGKFAKILRKRQRNKNFAEKHFRRQIFGVHLHVRPKNSPMQFLI
jgi:hypothetical protein